MSIRQSFTTLAEDNDMVLSSIPPVELDRGEKYKAYFEVYDIEVAFEFAVDVISKMNTRINKLEADISFLRKGVNGAGNR